MKVRTKYKIMLGVTTYNLINHFFSILIFIIHTKFSIINTTVNTTLKMKRKPTKNTKLHQEQTTGRKGLNIACGCGHSDLAAPILSRDNDA